MGICKCSKGKLTIKAKATFYAGANLPNNVLPPDMNKPSGALYYSPGGENLSGVQSNTVYREVHASWDCLDGMMHDTNVTGC